MKLQDEFREFLEATGLKQAHVARSIGVSAAVISTWLKESYSGDNSSIDKKLKSFMENYSTKNKEKAKAKEVKKLYNLVRSHFVMDEAVINSEMAAVYGKPGLGKTVAVKEWVKKHPEAIFIEVVPGIRVNSLLKTIAEKLGINPVNSAEENIKAIAKEFKRRDSVLVIDEAEHLSVNGLEAIRRIWDFSKVPTILVGTYALVKNLKGSKGELLQLYSRISGRWEFKELSDDDYEMLFDKLSSHIKKYTTHLRRAVTIYQKALRFATMQDEKVSAKHIGMAADMVFLD